MNLTLGIDNNLEAILLDNTGKRDINSEEVVFEGKTKKLQKAIKKAGDGQYWLFIDNAEKTRRFGLSFTKKNGVTNLYFC